MIGRFGVLELVLVLVIALVVFGPKKLPEIGKAIGQTLREFRGSVAARDKDEPTEREERGEKAEPARLSDGGGQVPGDPAGSENRNGEAVEAVQKEKEQSAAEEPRTI